jgi:hypothetical protein
MHKVLATEGAVLAAFAAADWRTLVFLAIGLALTLGVACWVLASDSRAARLGYLVRTWRGLPSSARRRRGPVHRRTSRRQLRPGRPPAPQAVLASPSDQSQRLDHEADSAVIPASVDER